VLSTNQKCTIFLIIYISKMDYPKRVKRYNLELNFKEKKW